MKGVNRDSRGDRWQARITINGKRRHLGYYFDWFDAVCAYKAAENLKPKCKKHRRVIHRPAIDVANMFCLGLGHANYRR